ncbi:hypothetical protein HDU78_007971 [Chytriomyces hyalinus]|nr:hypothetical protein HDU78_007971 [Chytriomyces hyalinus]
MNKTVVITGCSRGIGRALASHYISEGWNVIATARDVNNLDGLDAQQKVQLDVTSEESIAAAAFTIGHTPVHLLINNAGIAERDAMGGLTKSSLLAQMETNAVGPLLVTQALLNNLFAAALPGKPAVVAQVSSIVGSIEQNSEGSHYGYRASKTALNAYSTSMAIDLKHKNIAVIMLHPGYVETDMAPNGTLTKEESIAGMTKVISETFADATLSKTGGFFNQTGAAIPGKL